MPDGMDEKQFRSCSRTSDDRKIVGLTCILWMKLGPNQGEKEEEGRHERARYGLSYTYPWTIFLKHIFRRRERHQGSNFCTLPFSPPYSFMIHFVCRPQPMFFQPFAWRENRRDKRTIHALFPLFVNPSYNYRKKCVSITLLLLFLRWWWSKCCRSKRGELTGNRVSIPKAHNSTASPEIPLTKSAVVAVAGVARRAVQILWIRKCLLCSFFCFECLKPGHPYYKIFGGESKQRDRYASLLFLVLTLDSF